MFHKATKSLAKHLDPEGDLIPVRCLLDQNHFRPLCLVHKKEKDPWWRKYHFHKTDYKLCDVLLPEEHTAHPVLSLAICDSDTFTIVDHVDGKLEGGVTAVTALTTLETKSSATMSQARSVKVKKRHIDSRVLDSLNRNSKIQLDHPLIEESNMFQRNLYIVSETVETVEEAEFRDSNKTEGSILAELSLKISFTGLRGSKRAVIVPKDCTLAFRVRRLLIREESLHISVFPDDRRKTFQHGRCAEDAYSASFSGEWERKHEPMEVEQECAPLLSLSTDLCGIFLNGFLAIIRNNDLLQELELQLEQALDGIKPIQLTTGRPELQELVDNLQDSTGAICPDVAQSVLYFLQALDELSESGLLLLEESVERKIVPKQTALVRCILEKSVRNEERKFIIPTQKVSPFIEDEWVITEAMIKLSGVTVQRSRARPAVTGGSTDAFLALYALYAALYVLKILSD